ncbi:alpha-amylase [Methylocystis parvus]|uniref:alpha-amylase n=1 Tax=Methylocystis parvus TaxID=134 RepID=UPI001FCBFF62|nr:alpha-amylase [Methylocystis parvus]WBJ98576.1 alpha-amylase [Methylocystis parvus OBBP]
MPASAAAKRAAVVKAPPQLAPPDVAPQIVATQSRPPAPMGVFGADMPAKGKLVLAIAPIWANLSGQRIGAQGVSSEFIVSTIPWWVDPTKKLRLVPQNIAVASQTGVVSYGLSDDLSVVVTASIVEKRLEALTFKGQSGVTPLGRSYPGTFGLADFTTSAIYRIYQDPVHRVQVNLGFAYPFSYNAARFDLLQPDGTISNLRAFYGMQPGSGTFDILPGIVYAGNAGQWSWGLSYRARLPLAKNPENWRFGDLHEFNGWAGYTLIPGVTTTFRVSGVTQGQISGFDPQILGRAVPTNPAFYGGQRVELFGGGVVSGKFIGLDAASIAFEAGLPVYQNLNGPQIAKNWQAGFSLRLKI